MPAVQGGPRYPVPCPLYWSILLILKILSKMAFSLLLIDGQQAGGDLQDEDAHRRRVFRAGVVGGREKSPCDQLPSESWEATRRSRMPGYQPFQYSPPAWYIACVT